MELEHDHVIKVLEYIVGECVQVYTILALFSRDDIFTNFTKKHFVKI